MTLNHTNWKSNLKLKSDRHFGFMWKYFIFLFVLFILLNPNLFSDSSDKNYKEISIDQAIHMAIEKSPLLVLPSIKIDRAKLGLKDIQSQNIPQVQLSLRHFIDVFNSKRQRTVPSVDFDYDFLSFIKNVYQKKYYKKLLDISLTNKDHRQSILISTIYQEFVTYAFLRESFNTLEEQEKTLNTYQKILEIQKNHDLVPLSTVLDNQVMVKNVKKAIYTTKNSLNNLSERFSYIIGSEEKVYPEKITIDFRHFSASYIGDLAEEMSRKKVQAAEMLVKGAKMPNLPSLQINTYSVFPVNKELSFDKSFWISLSLSYMIIDAGKRKRRIASSLANLKEAEYEHEKFKMEKQEKIKKLEEDIENLRRELNIIDTEINSIEYKIDETKLEESDSIFSENIYFLKGRLYNKKLEQLRNNLALFLAQLDLMGKKYSFIMSSKRKM